MANELLKFIGRGGRQSLPSAGRSSADTSDVHSPEYELRDHPEGYIADADLVDAVNTALVLGRPLLLTGNPGTGKTQLADRIAWEFGLSPVLRFEAHSVSEAQDLFYRFDLVGQLGAVQMLKAQAKGLAPILEGETAFPKGVDPRMFITFGPLGKAILRAYPAPYTDLLQTAFSEEKEEKWIGQELEPRRSVVLIDEIDKTSRDFPNDLLNSIERLEFRIRELADRIVRVPRDEALRPIVIITSNSERRLPEPFLRRCAYLHIDDPTMDRLREIVRNRVFRDRAFFDRDDSGALASPHKLLPLYEQLLNVFMDYRRDRGGDLSYVPGPSELIDWARSLRQDESAQPSAGLQENMAIAKSKASTLAKSPEDRKILFEYLQHWSPASV